MTHRRRSPMIVAVVLTLATGISGAPSSGADDRDSSPPAETRSGAGAVGALLARPPRSCDGKPVRLLAVGDIQLGRRLWLEMQQRDDYTFPLGRTAQALSAADIAVGNLEAQIFPGCPDLEGGMRLCAGPRAIEGLVHAGFDVLSVANNHSHNFGQRALDASTKLLEQRGIAVAGYGAIPVVERGGTRFAFVAWTPVNRYSNIRRIKRHLKLARSQADVVVALVHWGNEYEAEPIADQVELAEYIAATGADLIIGAHPHVVQPLARVGTAQVAYSLGNFVFDSWMPEETKLGAVGEFGFCGSQLRSAELLPVRVDDPGVPRFIAPGTVPGWPPGSAQRDGSIARGCRSTGQMRL